MSFQQSTIVCYRVESQPWRMQRSTRNSWKMFSLEKYLSSDMSRCYQYKEGIVSKGQTNNSNSFCYSSHWSGRVCLSLAIPIQPIHSSSLSSFPLFLLPRRLSYEPTDPACLVGSSRAPSEIERGGQMKVICQHHSGGAFGASSVRSTGAGNILSHGLREIG